VYPVPGATIILPTYNERDNITLLINGVLDAVVPAPEVLVVDDDSPDGTWQVVDELAAEHPTIRLIRRTDERGLTSAIRRGIAEARGDVVVWMDTDLSMPPDKIPYLLDAMKDSDLAIGSRYVKGGRDVGHSFVAQAFSRTINLFAGLLLGFTTTDYTSGFVAARREVFDHITLQGDYGEYCIDLLYRARKLGYRLKEIPYDCVERHSGESKTATNVVGFITRGANYVVTILRLRFSGV
jgi:dolichol-phosphate mannosyltransferase